MTYARVSSIGQESEGQSLQNQERAFARAVEQRGWTRVRAYREAASAGTVEGRAEFSRMIDELAVTRPGAIVVDTLDRFTRNLREGLELLEQLRGHRVGLVPLDWRRDRPIDVDDDRDWSDVVDDFTAAERERRKIRRRILRSYEGRRERGATTTNRPAFGLRRAGDTLVADPETAWIVTEADRRVLAGEGYTAIAAWARTVHEDAWRTRTGVALSIRNEAYVAAGVRSAQTHAELAELVGRHDVKFGHSGRRHEHEFAGVFACGECVDRGYAPTSSLMHGGFQRGVECIRCDHTASVDTRGHVIQISAHRVGGRWRSLVGHAALLLAREEVLTRWAGDEQAAPDRRRLDRQLAALDQRVAALRDRRDRALDLLADPDPGVTRQVRKLLAEVDADDAALAASREALTGELARTARPRRDPVRLRAQLEAFERVYDRAAPRERNALSRGVCAALGGHPEVRRERRPGQQKATSLSVTWPAADALTSTEPLPSLSPKRPRR